MDDTGNVSVFSQEDKMQKSLLAINVIDRIYVIPVQQVRKITKIVSFESALGMPSYVVGLVNFHGDLLPVVDLALKLELKKTACYSINTTMIFTEVNDQTIGLIVDGVVGVQSNNYKAMDDKSLVSTNLLTPIILDNNKQAMLLNLERLIDGIDHDKP